MSRVRVNKTVSYDINLKEEEIIFLKRLCQNYLANDMRDEGVEEQKLREGLFDLFREAVGDK